jgi:hypothetical protein
MKTLMTMQMRVLLVMAAAEIRNCVNRQRPFGAEDWVATQVKEFGLETTVRRVGRPSRADRDAG